jgi:PAS domain-containing protein
MEPTSNVAGASVQSLLSLLAEGGGRHAALSVLHQRALQASGGVSSLLFELHPTQGHLVATSGAGIDTLPTDAWVIARDEGPLFAGLFADRVPVPFASLAEQLPRLHALLHTGSAILLPLLTDARRFGILAIGLDAGAPLAVSPLQESDVPAGFLLALELWHLRQREEFERDIRELLDEFALQLSATLELSRALEPLCVGAARLFGADRTTVWLHDRESRLLQPVASSDLSYLGKTASVRTDDPIASPAAALRMQRAGLAANGTEATSLLTVPLRGCRRALGTMVFEGVRIEPGDDISLLMRADELGRQLSSSVETIQLLGVVNQSRRELEQLFASLAHLVVVIDAHGSIVRVNRAFANAVGRTPEALSQQPLRSFIGEELMSWVRELPQPLERPAMIELTDTVLHGPYIVTATDFVTAEGRHTGRVLVLREASPANAT